MTSYALLVVVDATNEDEAWQLTADALRMAAHDQEQFIGTAWEVRPLAQDAQTRDRVFDTNDCIDQRS